MYLLYNCWVPHIASYPKERHGKSKQNDNQEQNFSLQLFYGRILDEKNPLVLVCDHRGESITENLYGLAHKKEKSRFDARHVWGRISDEPQKEEE